MAEDVVAPALGTAAMEAVVEIFLQVFWFGIFASTAGFFSSIYEILLGRNLLFLSFSC